MGVDDIGDFDVGHRRPSLVAAIGGDVQAGLIEAAWETTNAPSGRAHGFNF